MFEQIGSKLRMPLPQNDAEVEIVSEAYFGVPLHLKDIWICESGGSYEVLEDYNDYHGNDWPYDKCCIKGYDYSARFWGTVFGRLTCGGIARASYGQFKIKSHRHYRRLNNWTESRRSGRTDLPRQAFVRLARQYRDGREQNDSR